MSKLRLYLVYDLPDEVRALIEEAKDNIIPVMGGDDEIIGSEAEFNALMPLMHPLELANQGTLVHACLEMEDDDEAGG